MIFKIINSDDACNLKFIVSFSLFLLFENQFFSNKLLKHATFNMPHQFVSSLHTKSSSNLKTEAPSYIILHYLFDKQGRVIETNF